MLYTAPIRQSNTSPKGLEYSPLPRISTSVFRKELLHRSLITYTIPSERVRELVPMEFGVGETTVLTVESFLDYARSNFEQTNYRLHGQLQGRPCSWLLGTSLGSLSGVTARHLYPLPWHLSAMEFQVAIDPVTERYRKYRLNTQSQWANATWDIVDTGVPVRAIEQSLEITDHFVRRDGQLGSYQTLYKPTFTTRGQVQHGRCDRLEMLGLLSPDELRHPTAVQLQRAVSSEVKPAFSPLNTAVAV